MRLIHKRSSTLLAAVVLGRATTSIFAASFQSPNDLVLLQGNGDGGDFGQSGDSVTLTDYSITRTPSTDSMGHPDIVLSLTAANVFNLPKTGLSYNGSSNNGLTEPNIAFESHAGQLTLSQDGHSLEFGTYLTPVGPTYYQGYPFSPNNLPASVAPRVLTVLNSAGTLNYTTQLTGDSDYNSVDIRQVTSLNGTQFWTSGNGAKPYGDATDIGGLRYSTLGASTTNSLNIGTGIDVRTATIYQGQMYVAGGSDNNPTGIHTLSKLGTGINATTAQNWTPLPTNTPSGTILGNQSPCFITLSNGVSIVYESDSTTGDLEKWTLINGLWNFSSTYVAFGKDQIENITAHLNSDGTVTLFSDQNNSGLGSLFAYTDTGGAGPMNLSGIALSTSGNNKYYMPGIPILTATAVNGNSPSFYGLSFAPSASAAVADQIWGNLDGVTGAAGGSWGNVSNWSAAIPNASGTTATFGPGLASNASGGVITLDGSKTVGHLEFNDSAVNYTLAPGTGGTLSIDNTDPNSTGVPSIFNSVGAQTIAVPIALANGVTLASHYQASMVISGSISGMGPVQIYGPGALTLSGISNYSGATVVHSGPIVVTATGSLPATTDLTVGDSTDTLAVGLTASVAFNASTGTGIRPITLNSVTLASNGSVSIAPPTAVANRSVLVVGGLSFAGSAGAWTGLLNLTSNDLIIHNGNLATIRSEITEGYNSGHGLWQGSGGIISSTAATTGLLTTLGAVQNITITNTAWFSTFDGQSVTSSDVLVKYTYYGDANLDGHIDGSDYTLIDNGYNRGLTGWGNGDFNYDGVVDGSDYALIDNACNMQGAALASQLASDTAEINTGAGAGNTSAVPEPGMIGFPLISATALLCRRRHRQGSLTGAAGTQGHTVT